MIKNQQFRENSNNHWNAVKEMMQALTKATKPKVRNNVVIRMGNIPATIEPIRQILRKR